MRYIVREFSKLQFKDKSHVVSQWAQVASICVGIAAAILGYMHTQEKVFSDAKREVIDLRKELNEKLYSTVHADFFNRMSNAYRRRLDGDLNDAAYLEEITNLSRSNVATWLLLYNTYVMLHNCIAAEICDKETARLLFCGDIVFHYTVFAPYIITARKYVEYANEWETMTRELCADLSLGGRS